MPEDLLLRDARPDEAAFAAEMTRKMVVEIERYGGRPAARSQPAWEKIAEQIAADLQQETAKYLVAETISGQRIGYPQQGSSRLKEPSNRGEPCT